jgi:uncharacterized protein (DUF433 family)
MYEYLPLGKYIVSAAGVCAGRPTFKHTRIEVAGVLSWLCAGDSVEALLERYDGRVSRDATLLRAERLFSRSLFAQHASYNKADLGLPFVRES